MNIKKITGKGGRMKKAGVILALVFLCLLPLSQRLIATEAISEITLRDRNGATSHKDVKCTFSRNENLPGFISGVIEIKQPLQKSLWVHITTCRGGKYVFSGTIESSEDKGENGERKYFFGIGEDYLKESYIEIYHEPGVFRIYLTDVVSLLNNQGKD